MGLDPSGCRTFVAAFNFCCPAKIVVAYAPLNDCTAKAVGLRSANPTYSTNKRQGLKKTHLFFFFYYGFFFFKKRGEKTGGENKVGGRTSEPGKKGGNA